MHSAPSGRGNGKARVGEVDDAVGGGIETPGRLTVPDTMGYLLDHHVREPKLAECGTGLDEVEGDLERGLSRQRQGVDGVGVLVKDDRGGAKAARGDVDAFEVVVY